MAKDDKPKKDLTRFERLQNKLKKAGLKLSKDGTRIEAAKATTGGNVFGSPEQLALIQKAYEDFGISNNPYFDPSRVAYDPSVKKTEQSKAGRFIDLRTGVYMNGQGVASDALLAELRARTGWTAEAAYEGERARMTRARQVGLDKEGNPVYEDYVPSAFQTFEGFQTYIESARANYLASDFSEDRAQESKPGGALDLEGFGDEDLLGLSQAAQGMLQSRQRTQAAQDYGGPFFGYEDFFGEDEF